jgi:hypothetical protein
MAQELLNETLYNFPKVYKIALTIPCVVFGSYIFIKPVVDLVKDKLASRLENRIEEWDLEQ